MENERLDLDLWMNQELIKRQNRLKSQMWAMFSELGNTLATHPLVQYHPNSKGVKLSQGNNLLGYPYHVLDLIRSFEPNNGLNIRLLNWFGHGFYLFVYLGAGRIGNLPFDFLDQKLKYSTADDPFDYPGMILEKRYTIPESFENTPIGLQTWFKAIEASHSKEEMLTRMADSTIKILDILNRSVV